MKNIFSKEKAGFVFGDTTIEGAIFTYKDGSKEFIKCKKPLLYKSAEENNKTDEKTNKKV